MTPQNDSPVSDKALPVFQSAECGLDPAPPPGPLRSVPRLDHASHKRRWREVSGTIPSGRAERALATAHPDYSAVHRIKKPADYGSTRGQPPHAVVGLR